MIVDSAGWPCLKYFNHKMSAEQLVPLSQRAADAVRAHNTTWTTAGPPAARSCSPRLTPIPMEPKRSPTQPSVNGSPTGSSRSAYTTRPASP